MAAPKGNSFWKLRSKHGRDKIFESSEILWESACEYFQWCEDNPMKEAVVFHSQGMITHDNLNKMRPFTLTGLCLFLGVNSKYFNDFEDGLNEKEGKEVKDFSEIITRIRETIYTQKFEGAASGFLNPNIIARDLGLVDRKDIESSGQRLPNSGVIVEFVDFSANEDKTE